jgi:uncharacterized membrane protein
VARLPFYLVLAIVVFLPFVSSTIVERALRSSKRWQQRSQDGRRYLAVVPGALVAVVLLVLLALIQPPWF